MNTESSRSEYIGPYKILRGRWVSRDGGSCIALSGWVAGSSYPELLRAILELADRGGDLFLDLADVDYIDVSGLQCLIEARRLVAAGGQELQMLAPSQVVIEEIEGSGLGPALGL